MNEVIGIQDYVLGPVLFLLFAVAGYYYSNRKYGNSPLFKYFMFGLLLKMIGSAAAGAVFMFYYRITLLG